jgi:hypothetical protein
LSDAVGGSATSWQISSSLSVFADDNFQGKRPGYPAFEAWGVTTARGLGACGGVSIAGYPETGRGEPGILPQLSILCGPAFGYSDPDFPANRPHIGGEAIDQRVVLPDN